MYRQHGAVVPGAGWRAALPHLLATTEAATVTRLLTAQEVAREWQVPVSRIYAAARRGELPAIKLGRYTRFDPRDLEAWLERQRNGGRR